MQETKAINSLETAARAILLLPVESVPWRKVSRLFTDLFESSSVYNASVGKKVRVLQHLLPL